jgi:hypothetical protein
MPPEIIRPNGPHRRSSPRMAPELGMAPEPGQSGDDGVEIPLSNAWPTGLQTMGCLACDGPFISSGRHERLCSACRRRT